VIAAFPEAKELVPALRMIVVAGPRINPQTLPAHEGMEVRAYVHQLYRHLAACDLAVVQGGLTTSMELTANRRPFLYFPLRHHFEQNLHVRNRLERYRAGKCMDFEHETPETIAAAIAETIGCEVDYKPVETDGAARAAALIAPLLEERKGRRSPASPGDGLNRQRSGAKATRNGAATVVVGDPAGVPASG
jgi:UDP-N-acetylglucosamine:LPS N-acetylglucosamine transferase